MKHAFTLIEVLVVVAILAILTLAVIVSLTGQRDKASDARVKSDLDRLKIAFEDYYNDHNCYPPAAWFASAADCNSGNLKPYLNTIPCDPRTGLPYQLQTDATTCSWFKLYGKMISPSSSPVFLTPVQINGIAYNYGVSSTNVSLPFAPTSSPTPTPSPHPSVAPGSTYYYCSSLNNCSS